MGSSFLKKGKAAHKMHDKAEQEAEVKKALQGGPRRFWMPSDSETQITFLDGDLDDDGMLEAVSFWEHQLKINGNFRNWFFCTQLEEPCPVCEEDPKEAYLATVFTIIDHGEWKDNQGKTHKNERRLFVCKRDTFRRLQKIAAKRGGLRGITFDVSRNGDKSAGVGDTFEFVEKSTPNELKKAYGLDDEGITAFDYEEIFKPLSAKELRGLGFGKSGGAIGSEGAGKAHSHDDDDEPAPKPKKTGAKKPATDYSDEV